MLLQTIRSNVRILFNEAVSSVNPQKLTQDNVMITHCDRSIRPSSGVECLVIGGKEYNLQSNFHMVGFGKAVLGMARTIENLIRPHLNSGIISVPEGTQGDQPQTLTRALSHLQIIEGAKNNLPDKNAEKAAILIRDLVKRLTADDVLIVLISGGGSALLPLPVPAISLDEKLNVIKLLGNAGADIVDLNCVRKNLSQLKGGGLAHFAYPAQVVSLIISDVVGDPIEIIASGPTYPNLHTPHLAWEIIQKYNLESKISENVIKYFASIDNVDEERDFSHVNNIIIGSNFIALAAVHTKAQSMNYTPLILSDRVQGVARNLGVMYAALASSVCQLWSSQLSIEQFNLELEAIKKEHETNILIMELEQTIYLSKLLNKPLCLILGGETTVQVKGSGKGGRNQELALSFAINICERSKMYSHLRNFEVVLLSAGTDGIDGPTDVAGAIGHSQLINLAKIQNINPMSYLENNDSYNFFTKLNGGDDFIRTGHTGTNVMDIHILVIAPCPTSKL